MNQNAGLSRLELAAMELRERLQHRLQHLESGYAKVDPHSSDDELWAARIYEKLIDRQNRIIAGLID